MVDPPKAASHGWRRILAGRDLLVTNLSKAIGNGESTRIWKDPWLSSLHPIRPIGPAKEEHQDLVVADFLCRGSAVWNIQRIKEVLPQYLTDILNIKPSIMGAPDSFVWLASRSGVYTAKSGYYVAASKELTANRDEARPLQDQNLYKAIWASKIPPKLHLFLWKITQGALALGENLARRGVIVENQRPQIMCFFTVPSHDRYGPHTSGLLPLTQGFTTPILKLSSAQQRPPTSHH